MQSHPLSSLISVFRNQRLQYARLIAKCLRQKQSDLREDHHQRQADDLQRDEG